MYVDCAATKLTGMYRDMCENDARQATSDRDGLKQPPCAYVYDIINVSGDQPLSTTKVSHDLYVFTPPHVAKHVDYVLVADCFIPTVYDRTVHI